MFTHAPIHGNVTAPHGRTIVIDLFDQWMGCHAGRKGGDFFSQAMPLGHGNGRLSGISPFFAQKGSPVHGILALEVGQHRVNGVPSGIHGCTVSLGHLGTKLAAQALRCQLVSVEFARTRVGGDFFVHQRLRQRRGILLVVAELAKANNVKHHILVELHAVVQCPLHGQHHGLGVIAVDVHHRRFNTFDNIGAIQRGAGVTRVRGGKANLVIDDDMHRASGGVAAGLGQSQRFLIDPLAGKSRITVHQHGQHLATQRVAATIHTRSHRALHHRIDNFQV
ncbi:hypothetical protein GALL_409700 [mine drainage metagenome]|uniref:Uncharacterized protein n=1 Tax=mine drainage metagenome TaxID=410659 RepID=A0A1J5QBJ9_9ZZZZ